ncbi:MAG TPA: ABC transporter ATP-binding protein [Candidatus Pelethenecus faecipullorum]|uniref:ABC transporter ATP-binding protein n=1 Tax=Candidatus Pelethenecus faecipullorum TaxID=2840900 RepID=A0A9D1GRS1_9MOLU|nr:ABC transporter ATP-binding protein [Candidatus Pelethenecus faecipullorum]
MIKLLKYLDKAAWLMIVFIVGLVILQVYSDLELPGRLTNIITYASTSNALEVQGILTPEMKQEFTDRIINNALQMLGFAVLSMTASIIVGFLAARVAASYSYSLRKAIYRHIQDFSMIEIDRFSTASLITRTTNDITQIQMVVVMVLRMAISAPATAIMGILKASKIQGSSQLSLIVVFAVVALVVLVTTIFLLVMPKFKSIQGFTDKLNLVTRENLTGIRVVRAYGAMEYQEEKFDNVNRPLTKTNVFVNRMMNLMTPGMNIIMHGTSLSILWVGAYWVNENPLNLGNVFGFQQITMFIVMAFMQLIMIFIMVPRGLVSARRVNEVLQVQPSIWNAQVTKLPEESVRGEIEYQNVGFAYEHSDEKVLEDISFKATKGQTVAVIGSTGSGKTTLAHLLLRFFDVSDGRILLDGVDIKDYDLTVLRGKIGLIAQKSLLFKGTIRSNLSFGKEDATDEEMIEALKMAQAYDFVMKDPKGLDAPVSQGGNNFSGGQKQRLSIARALIKKPEILVFDDSFSALDFKTDKMLREGLQTLDYQPTKLIVAQRIGTIMDADLIVVLEKGRIAGLGTHEELLRSCAVYQEIAYSQFSKEELENA